MLTPTPVLEMRGITKRFGEIKALDGVDFTLLPGEIHALLGENGAGKSTLMNVLRGLVMPTAGRITLGGEPVTFRTPDDATRAGIGMVHQHFLLVPSFTVMENLTLAAEDRTFVLDPAPLLARAEAAAKRLGWSLPPPSVPIADLPVGTQQRVEILKALLGDARILLFDEPTAVLAPQEIDELLDVMRALRDESRSVVFVTHKLGEVMAVCDRVTVLQRGRLAGTVAVSETDPADLARRMVGESAMMMSGLSAPPPSVPTDTAPALVVQHLSTAPGKDTMPLHDLSFTLAPGEILGVAGVDGNGQAELAGALTGLRPWTAGSVAIGGMELTRLRPKDLERHGIALIPPDRHRQGLALTLSVAENLTLEAARLPQFQRGPFLDRPALRRFADQTARDFDIRAGNLNLPAGSLSGGNQQKIVIARALWREPRLLIAVSPTRGLDVSATAFVHARLRERQANGGAILLISTELDEVLALSTRVAVLYEGRLVGIVPPDTPRETLGLMMGGKEVYA
ncbi:MAG: ABC transporter ATP-binding protein [Armatimonadota bacterium]|nr:ABC transporter ATP-binding protein [Armatimonadota bacterium]